MFVSESTKDCFKWCCFIFNSHDKRGLTRSCVYSPAENRHGVLGGLKGQLHHWPVNHTGPQQNVFITVDNVSFVMDNVINTSIRRNPNYLVGGCAALAQHENSYELSVIVSPPPPTPHHQCLPSSLMVFYFS